MKKLIFLLAMVCGNWSLFAQTEIPIEEVNACEGNDMVQDLLKIHEKDKRYIGLSSRISNTGYRNPMLKDSLLHTGVVEIYSDEALTKIKKRISFQNYLKDGKEIFYHNTSSKIQYQNTYQQGKKIREEWYYDNGALSKEVYYENGKEQRWKTYHENGKPMASWTHFGDYIEYLSFYENGQLKRKEKRNKDRKLIGQIHEYQENGYLKKISFYDAESNRDSLLFYETYDENKPTSEAVIARKEYYDKEGNRTFYLIYKEGKLLEKHNLKTKERTKYHQDGSQTTTTISKQQRECDYYYGEHTIIKIDKTKKHLSYEVVLCFGFSESAYYELKGKRLKIKQPAGKKISEMKFFLQDGGKTLLVKTKNKKGGWTKTVFRKKE